MILSVAAIKAAAPGSTLTFDPGEDGPIAVDSPPAGITLDLTGVVSHGLRLTHAHGVTVRGGRFIKPTGSILGLEIVASDGVTIFGTGLIGARIGVRDSANVAISDTESHQGLGFSLRNSSDVTLSNVKVIDGGGDLIDFQDMTRLTIQDAYLVGGGYSVMDPLSNLNQHPDAIQGFGVNKDITIRRVRIAGRCQGIFITDGSVDGLTIDDVTFVTDGYKWAVSAWAISPPRISNLRAYAATAGADQHLPAFDFRKATSSPLWIDGGGNSVNGAPLTAANIAVP